MPINVSIEELDDEDPIVDLVDTKLVGPDEEKTPSDKLLEIIDAFGKRFEQDPRYSCHIWRDAPQTDAFNIPCKGFLGQFNFIPTEPELKARFGGQLYHLLVKGPRRDLETGKVDIKTLASVRGLMIAGPVVPNPEDRHYQNEEGYKRIKETRESVHEARSGSNGSNGSSGPPLPTQLRAMSEGPPRPQRTYSVNPPTATAMDPLASKKLEADLEERKALRERAWKIEDQARQALLEKSSAGGMDAETVKALFSEMKAGNQAAIEKFADTVSDGSKKSAEAMARVLEMFQAKVNEPKDDREEKRLKELLDSAQEDIRSLRAAHQAELTRITETRRLEIKDLQEARDKAEERVARDLKENFERERVEWRRTSDRLEAAISALREEVKREEKRGDDRVESLKSSHDAMLSGIKRDYETREKMLDQRIRDFEARVEAAREREINLRDAKQTEAMGKMRAEIERDNAVRDSERMDLEKLTKATGMGKTVAEALGYEKPDNSAPSPWASIGEKVVEVAGSVVTNERFASLMGALAGGVRQAQQAQPNPALPPPQPQPTQPQQGQVSYEEMVARKKDERRRALEEKQLERRRQLTPPAPGVPSEKRALDAIEKALSDRLAAPRPEPEKVEEPKEQDDGDWSALLIEQLEDLAAVNASPEQALDLALSGFNVSRTEAKMFITGKSGDEILKFIKVDPVEVSAKARTLLNSAMVLLTENKKGD